MPQLAFDRSALCLRTAASKPVREMSCNICGNMLHTLLKAESSSDFVAFGKLNLSENSALFLMGGAQQRGANLDECDCRVRTRQVHGAESARQAPRSTERLAECHVWRAIRIPVHFCPRGRRSGPI